jgi:hypothetical protein
MMLIVWRADSANNQFLLANISSPKALLGKPAVAPAGPPLAQSTAGQASSGTRREL